MNRPRATIDFETRSACKLRACGAWRYSVDPTTEILCMAFRLPYWEKGRTGLWLPPDSASYLSYDDPANEYADWDELLEWIKSGRQVEAHNCWFERCL